MASTKEPKISKESIEKNKELKTIDEMYRELDREIKKRDNSVHSHKNKIIDDVFENGEDFVKEMDENKEHRKNQKENLVLFILEKHGSKFGGYNYLNSFSYEDLVKYYEYKLSTNYSFFKKILKFFNLIK